MTVDSAMPILALVGPTGTGKSDVALTLAEKLGGEIISCDSVQVYRGFDIGSAKPTAAERARVPHHLVDVADWGDPYDAAAFCRHAEAAITEVQGRGRLPVLCGGTGLYLRALRYGLMPTPAVDQALREQLAADEAREPGVLYARLLLLDPKSAQKVHPTNLQRVMRALELCLQTRQPASALRDAHGFKGERLPMLVCWLDRASDALRARIAARTQVMLDAGWVAEVQHLLAQGVSPACRPMQAVGYREIVAHVQNPGPEEVLAGAIATSTWQYARRQRTWWRRERDVYKVDMDQNDVVASLLELWSHSRRSPLI